MRWPGTLILLFLTVGFGRSVGTQAIDVSHAQQQAPIEIFLTQFNYQEQSGTYRAVVSITDPGRVGRIDPRLLDLQTGENTRFGDLVPVTGTELEFELPTDQLQSGRKYRLAIRAFEPGTTTYIRRPSQNPAEDPLVFASQEFAYNPPQLAPIVFAVDGVSADFASHTLLIAIHHSDTPRPLRYEAVVVDKRGGAVGRVDRTDLTLKNGIVESPLPAAMERADQPAEYHLTFRLYTTDNKLVGEQRKDFTLPAPPVPSLVERTSIALSTYPWLGWSLAGIAACLLFAYLFHALVPRKRKPLPRPQNLEPVYIQASAPGASRNALPGDPRPGLGPAAADLPPGRATLLTVAYDESAARLIVASDSAPGREHLLMESEVTVGRAEDNGIVIEDIYVSRRHARIVRQDDRHIWIDSEEVTQPTSINGAGVKGPQTLHDGDKIDVGETTLTFREGQRKQAGAAQPRGIA